MSSDVEAARRAISVLLAWDHRNPAIDRYLAGVARVAVELLHVDRAVVTIASSGFARVVAAAPPGVSDELVHAVHGSVNDVVSRTGRPVMVPGADEALKLPSGFTAYLGVPLRSEGGAVLGTICAFSRSPRGFTESDLATGRLLAECAARSLENHQLYEDALGLARLGQSTATLVHELRSPLTAITMGLYVLHRDGPTHLRDHLSLLLGEAERLDRMVRDALSFAQPLQLHRELFDLRAFVVRRIELLRALPEAARCTIAAPQYGDPLRVEADRDRLVQVLFNLVRNACEATADRGTVRIELAREGGRVGLIVWNPGVIPQHLLSRLPAPFLTTRRNGSGLGLSVVDRIARAHGGTLRIESGPGRGTAVSIWLPAQDS
ncbi:MAG: GAF domain-containing sensor histidine kinase [Deltaproteobacteria bacterium]|nr:GAF domain-containing sensor histidine kinase [Deltaproteobacteria bacterium]